MTTHEKLNQHIFFEPTKFNTMRCISQRYAATLTYNKNRASRISEYESTLVAWTEGLSMPMIERHQLVSAQFYCDKYDELIKAMENATYYKTYIMTMFKNWYYKNRRRELRSPVMEELEEKHDMPKDQELDDFLDIENAKKKLFAMLYILENGTDRNKEVVQLFIPGTKSIKEVALVLGVSDRQVKRYKADMYTAIEEYILT